MDCPPRVIMVQSPAPMFLLGYTMRQLAWKDKKNLATGLKYRSNQQEIACVTKALDAYFNRHVSC